MVWPAQAATLIGMIQAPTLYDPRRHPDYLSGVGALIDKRPGAALRHLAVPSEAPRFGLYRTPMWEEAEPATAAALRA